MSRATRRPGRLLKAMVGQFEWNPRGGLRLVAEIGKSIKGAWIERKGLEGRTVKGAVSLLYCNTNEAGIVQISWEGSCLRTAGG